MWLLLQIACVTLKSHKSGSTTMATVNATSNEDMRRKLERVTECVVCADIFCDPRLLPCVHTYCMKCIAGFYADKAPGDKAPCPLCQKKFKILVGGVKDLPKNFFMEQLKDILDPSSIHCEVCSYTNEAEVAGKKVASMTCVECHERLCDVCAGTHG